MSVQDVTSALQDFLQVQTYRAQLYARFQEVFKIFLITKREGDYKALIVELTTAFNDCSRKVIAIEAALKEMGRTDLAATLRIIQESERDKLRLTLTLQALKQAVAFRTLSWQQQEQHGGSSGGDNDDDEALALLDPHFAATARSGGCANGHAHCNSHVQGRDGQGAHVHGIDKAAGPEKGYRDSGVRVRGPCSDEAAVAADGVVTRRIRGLSLEDESGAIADGNARGIGDGAKRDRNPSANRDGKGQNGGDSTSCSDGGGGDGRRPSEPSRREFEAAVKEAMQGLDTCIRKINEAIGEIRMELEGV